MNISRIYVYVHTWDLLIRMTFRLCSANPRMSGAMLPMGGKSKHSSSYSVYKAGCLDWSSSYAGAPKK